MNEKTQSYLLLTLIVFVTIALLPIGMWASDVIIFASLSKMINKQIVYQTVTLMITITLLFILKKTKSKEFAVYFNKGNISASILPEPLVGIKPKPTENWFHFGRNFSIVVSLVTATVIYFQIIKGSNIIWQDLLKVLPWSILFSLVNSFVEEGITRLGIVVVLKNIVSDKTIALLSGALFGAVHYWGNPGGITGSLVAGFLGWLLAKSIIETKGIFWAWFIHFLQDVIIFCALLSLT